LISRKPLETVPHIVQRDPRFGLIIGPSLLVSAGGKLVAENVRLSHTWCNNRDYGWRTQIRTLLAKGKSLAEIAETLNRKDVPPAHGTNRWTAAMVRKAYVS
jgi:hypothetical protein